MTLTAVLAPSLRSQWKLKETGTTFRFSTATKVISVLPLARFLADADALPIEIVSWACACAREARAKASAGTRTDTVLFVFDSFPDERFHGVADVCGESRLLV
jgi:hypothetical protein